MYFQFSSFSGIGFMTFFVLFMLSTFLLCLKGLLLASRCVCCSCRRQASRSQFRDEVTEEDQLAAQLSAEQEGLEGCRVMLYCAPPPPPSDRPGTPPPLVHHPEKRNQSPRGRGRANLPVFPLSIFPSAQGSLCKTMKLGRVGETALKVFVIFFFPVQKV